MGNPFDHDSVRTEILHDVESPVRVPDPDTAGLISYALFVNDYKNAVKLLRQMRKFCKFIMFDSGAFTIRRRGLEVDLSRYLACAQRLADEGLIDVVVNLDVGNTPQMRRNFARIVRVIGDRAYPLWVHQPIHGFKMLEEYAKDWPYVGLGTLGMDNHSGAAVERAKPQHDFYRACSRILFHYGAGCHGFAMTSIRMLMDTELAWLTADSSSWAGLPRFGFAPLYERAREKAPGFPHPYHHIKRKTGIGNTIATVSLDRALPILRSYGINVSRWNRMSRAEASAVIITGYNAIQDKAAAKRTDVDYQTRLRDNLLAVGLPGTDWLASIQGPLRILYVVIAENGMISLRASAAIRKNIYDRTSETAP